MTMEQLTEQKLEEYKAAFNLFDTDGSNSISAKELGDVMRKLGQDPSEEELRDLIREFDTSENGQIEFDEFCIMVAKSNKDKCCLQAAFRTFDKNGDGKISACELRHVMSSLGEDMTMEEVELMIKEHDVNNDGQIDYEEFVTAMKKEGI